MSEQRKKFEIEIEETFDLEAIAETSYKSSRDFCKMVTELFKSVFADFEGTIFEATQGGEPTLSLIFNHGKYDDNAIVGCTLADGKVSGNSVLDRTRNRDRRLSEGDRYHLTDDAKDVITTLLIPKYYNNGNPNWGIIAGEWSEQPTGGYGYMPNQIPQYTKVSGISLSRLCSLLFGKKDKNSNPVEYEVRIATAIAPSGYAMMGMSQNVNYILGITVVNSAEVQKIYEKLGYSGSSARIIR